MRDDLVDLGLGHQAGDAAEVERHERGDELVDGHLSRMMGDGGVIDDARPQLVGQVELSIGGQGLDRLKDFR